MITETLKKTSKEEIGKVLSTNMDKTIVVQVLRKIRHPKYGKVINQRKKYYVHDELNVAQVDEKVLIAETRPLSKLKRWRLVKVMEKNHNEANVSVKE